MGRFEARTAVVTGAGGAIGAATARRLADEGATVLAVDLDEAAVERTATAIRDAGGRAETCVADVRRAGDAERYAAAGAELGGGSIDLFCNNAGIEGPSGLVEETPDEAFDEVIAVNVRGVFLGFKHVLGHMRPGAAIVATGSTGSLGGTAYHGAYVASKHAVLGLSRSAARELAPRGIRVNVVCPGPVEGRMMRSIEGALGGTRIRDSLLAQIPEGRYAAPEDVAAAICHLLSDDAGHVTGTAYVVDGGRIA